MKFVRSLVLAAVVAGATVAGARAQGTGLTLGTASLGGTYFVYGGVVASLLTEKLGVNVSTQQTQGPNQNIILVSRREIDLGMATMGIALEAWEGKKEGWGGKQYRDVRALFPMYDTPFHVVALAKSGIKTVADLRDKKVGMGPRAGTCGTYYPRIFKELGVNVTPRFGQAGDIAGQLGDSLIHAFAFCAGVPIAAFVELDGTKDVRFFAFTADEIKVIRSAMPELSESTIPKGTYKSQKDDIKTVGIYNFFVTHKDLDTDLAYRIVKVVMENNRELMNGHAAAKETLIENWTKNTFLPFHPGAIKYFAEKGIDIPDNLR